ncbi:stage 0 sporulation protein B (sporulation initiation phosphotransferase) [Lentibacillus persicus]|uniref:Stage 0 sporulation protein B (Sporulation initiation phosphotransferase) n=1 Tax=Lentibacillus persicus TaxID=640948 RepID=A0A1I1TH52_9BACI|nr:Spo0B domain-containing protein [Lentibacillus persicus]SFD57927.1 stage 0 sporulation protein B (sporulation initiation phosphotransferase) [Lentibacillus persicus]
MEEEKVIELIRHYRHNLMNHLQIIHGYASMGKTDKVQQKINNYIAYLEEERKLVNLNAPAFALYFLQFDSLHSNFRLTYHIETEHKDLQPIDKLLVKRCKQLMENVVRLTDKLEIYELTVRLYDLASKEIRLEFIVKDCLQHNINADNSQETAIYNDGNDMVCAVSVIYE